MVYTQKILFASLFALSLIVAAPAFADDNGPRPMMGGEGNGMRGIVGTVSAVSGSTVTVSAKSGSTFTVDVSGATIERVPNTPITVGDIVVGDALLVQGSISGSSVTAVRVIDGLSTGIPMPPARFERGDRGPRPPEDVNDDEDNQERPASSSIPDRVMGEKVGWLMGLSQSFFRREDTKRNENAGAPKAELGGKVISVSGATFSLEMPAVRDRATSTATIMTNASTSFVKVGAGVGALADVTVGSFAKVQGIVTSTSTMTIAAIRVQIATSAPRMIGPKGEDVKDLIASDERSESTTSSERAEGDRPALPGRLKDFLSNFLGRFGGFFGR